MIIDMRYLNKLQTFKDSFLLSLLPLEVGSKVLTGDWSEDGAGLNVSIIDFNGKKEVRNQNFLYLISCNLQDRHLRQASCLYL